MAALADQVRENPVILPQFEVLDSDGHISARRSPQPISTARTARLRTARSSGPDGEATSFLPCSSESQLPTRTPSRLAPFTLRMPAAKSGLRRPQSEASYSSRRTAASRRLIVAGAYLRCSKAIRSSDDGFVER